MESEVMAKAKKELALKAHLEEMRRQETEMLEAVAAADPNCWAIDAKVSFSLYWIVGH